MEALEFRVDEKTRNCGKPLKELQLRKNVLIAWITRGKMPVIPDGESTVAVGDTLVVVTNGDVVLHTLNDMFA